MKILVTRKSGWENIYPVSEYDEQAKQALVKKIDDLTNAVKVTRDNQAPIKPNEPMTHKKSYQQYCKACAERQDFPSSFEKFTGLTEEAARAEDQAAMEKYHKELQAYEAFQADLERGKSVKAHETETQQAQQSDLQRDKDKLEDLNQPISYEQVIVEPGDVDRDGKLTTAAKKSLDTLGLRPVEVDALNEHCVAAHALKKQSQAGIDYFNNHEKNYVNACMAPLNLDMPLVKQLQRFEENTKTLTKPSPEQRTTGFSRWLSKIGDIFLNLFNWVNKAEKREEIDKNYQAAKTVQKEGFFTRFQETKEKYQTNTLKVAAERDFIREFKKASQSLDAINTVIQSRQLFKQKGAKARNLSEAMQGDPKYFDESGKLMDNAPDTWQFEVGRARQAIDDLSASGIMFGELTDAEAVVIDALVFETCAKVHSTPAYKAAIEGSSDKINDLNRRRSSKATPDELVQYDQEIQAERKHMAFFQDIAAASPAVQAALKEGATEMLKNVRAVIQKARGPEATTPDPEPQRRSP